MTVGQAARRTGLSPRAVRFYEAEDVLPAAERSTSGYRIYTEHELELLQLVARLRAVGLSLADIREGPAAPRARHAAARSHHQVAAEQGHTDRSGDR